MCLPLGAPAGRQTTDPAPASTRPTIAKQTTMLQIKVVKEIRKLVI